MLIRIEPSVALRKSRDANRVCRLAAAALLFVVGAPWAANCAEEGKAIPMVLTQVPVRPKQSRADSGSSASARAEWFEGARVAVVSAKGSVRVLSTGFAAACDPDVSFDGAHVVFAGKKGVHSPWAIWETGVEGGKCRPITGQAHDCRSPVYLSSLFTLDSPEPWFTVLYVGREDTPNEQGTGFGTSLYSVKLNGTEQRRITFNPMGDLDPWQAGDGRLLYAGWRNAAQLPASGKPLLPQTQGCRCSLFAINIDGTDQELYGAEQGGAIQRMPCVTEDGVAVFVETEADRGESGGQLAAVEERRPHHSYRKVPADSRFAYLYPSPLRGNTVLVSRRAREGRGSWSVVALDVNTGQAAPVFEDGRFDAVQAKAIRSRPMPDGRSTVVNRDYDTGILYALNLYEADEALKQHLLPGSIQRVRVIEGVPAQGPRGASSSACAPEFGRRLLGEAPVEKDGSLHLEVPADAPLELQAIDAQGMALATCRWIWVKQKENRGCIGCHEDHELVPENLYAQAVQRPPNNLVLPVERRRSVGFREQVLPLLQTRCAAADCHGGGRTCLSLACAQGDAARKVYEALRAPEDGGSREPKPGGRASSRALTSADVWARGDARPPGQQGKYVDPGRARTSFLIWELAGRDTSRPWDQFGSVLHPNREIKHMPPPGKAAPLTEEEFRLLIEWIDLGAAWETPPQPTSAVVKKPGRAKTAGAPETGGM
jgi:hypothetical protein